MCDMAPKRSLIDSYGGRTLKTIDAPSEEVECDNGEDNRQRYEEHCEEEVFAD